MSQKTAKKIRKEARKFVEKNKDIVLEEVLFTLRNSKLKEKLAFCIVILFPGKKIKL